MNNDDVHGFPSIEVVYKLKELVGRRVQVVENSFRTFPSDKFVEHFQGCTGTIVAHTPMMLGLTDPIAFWFFVPDEGVGMVIPIEPTSVFFIDEELDEFF